MCPQHNVLFDRFVDKICSERPTFNSVADLYELSVQFLNGELKNNTGFLWVVHFSISRSIKKQNFCLYLFTLLVLVEPGVNIGNVLSSFFTS